VQILSENLALRLNDSGFTEIINAPSAVRFRRGLGVNSNLVCQRCVCTLNI
jgi:hypothetical protein